VENILLAGRRGFSAGKFSLYNKYLNVLLLQTADTYISAMYQRHLRTKRKGKELKKEQNFYQRMQIDI